MSKISTYPELGNPTLGDLLIGTDVSNDNETKNFTISSILALGGLVGGPYVPYTGANDNVNLGTYTLSTLRLLTNSIIPQSGNILYTGGQSVTELGIRINFETGIVDLGDYLGNSSGIFFTINNDESAIYSSFDSTPTGIALTPQVVALGDIASVYSGLNIVIDSSTNFIYTRMGDEDAYKGYFFDFNNNNYYFGDVGQTNSGTTLAIIDSQSIIATGKGDPFFGKGLFMDISGSYPIVSIGDFQQLTGGNNTFITVNDIDEKLVLSDNCAVEVSNGIGSAGQVLISQGAAASPIWGDMVTAKITTTERDNIVSPAAGLMIYDTTVNKVSVYNGTMWKYLAYE